MSEKNPFMEDAVRLKASDLEDLLQEMLSISNTIESNKGPKFDMDKLVLYTTAFTKYMLLKSDHWIVQEYPTDSVYGAYQTIMNYFINQPIESYILEENSYNYLNSNNEIIKK